MNNMILSDKVAWFDDFVLDFNKALVIFVCFNRFKSFREGSNFPRVVVFP